MSGILNQTGAVSGILGTTVGTPAGVPAGGVVQTSKTSDLNSGHVYTSSGSIVASGITVSSPATTGSNYNIITFHSVSWGDAGATGLYTVYASKNGGAYANVLTGTGSTNGLLEHTYHATEYANINFTIVDPSPSTAGVNLYQVYYYMVTSNFHLVHNGKEYAMIVQEIKV